MPDYAPIAHPGSKPAKTLSQQVAEDGLSALDKKLIRQASSDKRTPKDLSNAVGGIWSPEECLARLIELTDSADYLSVQREKRLTLLNAREMMESMHDDVIRLGDNKARDTYLKLLTSVMDMLDRVNVDIDAVSTKLTPVYAEVMVQAILKAFAEIPAKLEERGITIEMKEIEGVFREVLPVAAEMVESAIQTDE